MIFDLPSDIRQIIFRKARWILAKDRLEPLLEWSLKQQIKNFDLDTHKYWISTLDFKLTPSKFISIKNTDQTFVVSTLWVSTFELGKVHLDLYEFPCGYVRCRLCSIKQSYFDASDDPPNFCTNWFNDNREIEARLHHLQYRPQDDGLRVPN